MVYNFSFLRSFVNEGKPNFLVGSNFVWIIQIDIKGDTETNFPKYKSI